MAADFLRRLIEAVPYRVHTVLTDNVTQFTDLGQRNLLPSRNQGEDRPAAALPRTPSNMPAPSTMSIIG
jgi:hypothetical protein